MALQGSQFLEIAKDSVKSVPFMYKPANPESIPTSTYWGWWKSSLGFLYKLLEKGTSLVVQWLRLWASTASGAGSIPVQRTRIPHAAWCSQA